MDAKEFAKARETFIKNIVRLTQEGILTRDQALDALDRQQIPTTPEEKELYRQQINELLK